MAVTDNTSLYDGMQWEGEVFAPALFKGGLSSRFRTFDGVKDKLNLTDINESDNFLFTGSGCSFTDTGTTTIAEKQISATTYNINKQYCVDTFEQNWMGEMLAKGANNNDLPDVFRQWVQEFHVAKISDLLEKQAISEIETELAADSEVIDETLGAISTSNAIAAFGNMYEAAKNEVVFMDDYVFLTSYDVAKKYQINAINTQAPQTLVTQNEMRYQGIEIIPVAGISTGAIIGARLSNMVKLTDLENDESGLQFIDMRQTTGDMTIREVGRFKFKCSYIFGDEITYGVES